MDTYKELEKLFRELRQQLGTKAGVFHLDEFRQQKKEKELEDSKGDSGK